eukprot:3668452-Pleurochrysis_carterae.AAC.1
MQERKLRRGSVRRCGVKGGRSHRPSTTGTDLAASSGVPPATALNCRPVQGSNTGVGVSIGGDGLSMSLPPVAFDAAVISSTFVLVYKYSVIYMTIKLTKASTYILIQNMHSLQRAGSS